MPNPDYINKPASNILANRLANKVKNSDSNSGASTQTTQQLVIKELKHSSSNSGSSSSPHPQQIQSSGEASKQTSSPHPNLKTGDTIERANNLSLGTIDTFLPIAEIQLDKETTMSSDDDSPKAKKASRRSSVDGSKKKKKSSRRRTVDGDERKKDKDKVEEKVNGEEDRTRKLRKVRDVSFSGSTIKRVEEKEQSPLNSALGDSSESLQSALKKTSKYGRNSSGGNSTDEEAPRQRISFGDITAVAAISNPAPQAPDAAAIERRKSMFKRAAMGGSGTKLVDPPVENGAPERPIRRTLSTPDTPSPDEMFPKPEPMQRRSSAPNLVKRKSLSWSSDGNDHGLNGSLKSRKSILSGGLAGASVDHMRRSAMSTDDQIYVPPKSRYHSVLQAWGHVMAGRVTELVLWTYGASFAKVMLFFLGFYVSNIFVWAFFIMWADTLSTNGNSCLYGDDADNPLFARYEMAFELSWCTFTTVGYGAISPPGDDWGCYPLRLVCALVAFIGVLFGSTTAAIMYSKLMRLLAQAQVTFSSTLCVQYGKGNEGSTVRFGQLNFRASVAAVKLNAMDLLKDDDDEKGGSSEDGYPVIEFRMVNDRANRESSEIWDAQISGVVQLLKEEQPKDGIGSSRDLMAKAEGGESTLDLEKVVYYPVKLTPDSHPHFSRIWYARHVLNAESPLLKREFRDMIAQDGKWDPDFNTWQEIRDSLNPFISLRITLSGTSAVSAASVYAEHVYEFDDVCVGWRFANMVYEDSYKPLTSWWHKLRMGKEDENKLKRPDLSTKVDIKLLHDIVPQPGDDHEPLGDENSVSGIDTSFRKMKFW